MFLRTAGDFAAIILDGVLDSASCIVCLHEIYRADLTEERTSIGPILRFAFRPVEVARKLIVAVPVLLHHNAETMTEILPDPFSFRVEILKDWSVVVIGMIDDLHLRI